MLDFINLAQQCAPRVEPHTLAAIVNVESNYNPYAIGVVGGHLERQPKTKDEAIATAIELEQQHWNFSVGISQVNRWNLTKYRMTYKEAFEPCTNLHAGAMILEDCYMRAHEHFSQQQALRAAFSCYYSGNFSRGFQPDKTGQLSYVQKILASADLPAPAIPVIPDIKIATKPPKISKPSEEANDPIVFETTPPSIQNKDIDPQKLDINKNNEQQAIVF